MNLSGAFRGLGVGLTQASQFQLQQQALDRRDQVLADREQALAHLRSEQSHQDILDKARADVAVHAANVDTDTAAKKDLLPAETNAQIQVNRDKLLTDFNIWLKKQPVELQGKLTLADFEQDRLDKRNNATQAAETARTSMVQDRTDKRSAADRAAHVEFQGTNDSGDLVVGHGDGGVSTVEGVKPKATVDLFGGGMGGLPTPAGTAAATSTPRPIKVTTQAPDGGDTAAPSKPPNTYTMSDLTYTATRYGITTDEARRRLNAAGYRLTN